jgi:hypothetical protein
MLRARHAPHEGLLRCAIRVEYLISDAAGLRKYIRVAARCTISAYALLIGAAATPMTARPGYRFTLI